MCDVVRSKVTEAIDWFRTIKSVFGSEFIYTLSIAQHVIKGFLAGGGYEGLVGTTMNYLFRSIGDINASKLQIYRAVAITPWSMKSLLGFCSDLFPIYGRNKAPYILASTATSMAAMFFLVFFWPLSAEMVVICLFFMFLQVAMADLLTEAKYAEKLKEHPVHGPSLMSYVWGGIFTAQLFSVGVVGVMLDYINPRWIYLFTIPVAFTIVPPMMKNWLGEGELTGVCIAMDRAKLMADKKIFAVSVLLGVFSIASAVLGIVVDSEAVLLSCTLVFAVILIITFYMALPKNIFKIEIFFFVQHMFTISVESASFYFYTDTAEQYPGGPNFSAFYYVTVIGVVSAVCCIIGVAIYNKYMKNWNYRTIFMLNNLLFMAVNLLNVIVYLRWNRKVGIPDELFVLGADAFQNIVRQWTWIPGIVILSQLCPAGVEATMYALLAGAQNFGGNLSNYAGAYMLAELGIQPSGADGEQAMFDNLWIAGLIAAIAPCIPLVLIPILIPDAKQTDRLIEQADGSIGSISSDYGELNADVPDDVELSDVTVYEQPGDEVHDTLMRQ